MCLGPRIREDDGDPVLDTAHRRHHFDARRRPPHQEYDRASERGVRPAPLGVAAEIRGATVTKRDDLVEIVLIERQCSVNDQLHCNSGESMGNLRSHLPVA